MIKVFSHTDLDGMGCVLLLKNYFGDSILDISYVDHTNVNVELYKFLKEKKIREYDEIYITDISISEKMAEWVDSSFRDKVILIDHHINKGTEHLNKYDWVVLKGNKDINDNELCSATWLVKEYLEQKYNKKHSYLMEDVVTSIDRYDTWLWKTKYNNYQPSKKLNDLYYLIGRENLLRDIELQQLNAIGDRLDKYRIKKEYKALLSYREEKYKTMLENCNKYMQKLIYKDYTIGLIYANEFTSELGNDLAKLNTDLDFIALANLTTGTISFRGVKDYIHLGNFAKELGESIECNGGGHYASSGLTLSSKLKNNIMLSIFKEGKFI